MLSVDEMDQILELDEKNHGPRATGDAPRCFMNFAPTMASTIHRSLPQPLLHHRRQHRRNAGGIRAVKYGVTSDYVVGLEVVLANGDIIHTGGKLIKNVTGYNMTNSSSALRAP